MSGKCAAEIIGGSDGPTSIFIAGKKEKNVFRRIRNSICRKKYQRRRDRVMAELKPEPHTLEELCAYITEKYGAVELETSQRRYQEGYRNTKAAMVQKYRPELLGPPLEDYHPEDVNDFEALKVFLDKCDEYQKTAANLPDDVFPIDYHCYVIREDGGELHIEIEKNYEMMGVGFSSEKQMKKQFEQKLRDIYLYYGVTKEDMETGSDRMKSLIAVLTV